MGERAQWRLGEWDEHLGYDCMTGGVRVGPVLLDGADYGQRRCQPIQPADKARLLEDARLIAAAPDLLEALKEARGWIDLAEDLGRDNSKALALVDAALAKASHHG